MIVTIEITPLVIHPEQITSEHTVMLKKYAEDAPWCSAFKIALARGYSNQESYLQDKYLRLAATYTGDNETLFNFMTTMGTWEEEKLANKGKLSEVKEEISITLNTDKKVESKEHLNNEKVSKQDEMLLTKGGNVENLKESETKIKRNGNSSGKNTEDENILQSEVQDLEQKKIVSPKEQKNILPKIDFETLVTYDPLKELKPNNRYSEIKEQIPAHFVVYNPQEELSRLIEEKEVQQEHDFLFWINNLDNKKTKSTSGKKSPDHVQNLLDQFLATKRSRPIKNAEFYKAETKAEESEVDKMEVVSETLCALYEKQGYFMKAIEGYKKLSLQNPDKSAYFAALIKKIETKIQN